MSTTIVSPQQALWRLRAGNERFISGTRSIEAMISPLRRHELVEGQAPFATILTCSDSRVPVELVFDQGLGDLFVIRVAGNVVAPSLVGSVEYAAAVLNSQLVVVMGHSRCGAVKATLDVLRGRGDVPSENIRDIVERIRPAIAPIVDSSDGLDAAGLLDEAILANARASTDHLRHASPLLEARIQSGELAVVGANYDIGTGRVDFFDVPATLQKAPPARAADGASDGAVAIA